MHFRKAEFREALILQTPLLDLHIITALRASLDHTPNGHSWQEALFTEIHHILTHPHSLPLLKVSCAKFLIYLFLLGDASIHRLIGSRIYPLVKIYAQVDRQLPFSERGKNSFVDHPYYSRSSQSGQNTMRDLGLEFIRFFVETVPVWATWIPADIENQSQQSVYLQGFRQLTMRGLQFPTQDQYTIYNTKNIQDIESKLKAILQRVQSNRSVNISNTQARRSHSIVSKASSGLSLADNSSLGDQQEMIVSTKRELKMAEYQPMEMVSTPTMTATNVRTLYLQDPMVPSLLSSRSKVKNGSESLPQHLLEVKEKSMCIGSSQMWVSIEQKYQARLEELSRVHKVAVAEIQAQHKRQKQDLYRQYEKLKSQNHTLRQEILQKTTEIERHSSLINSLNHQKSRITHHYEHLLNSTRTQSLRSINSNAEEVRQLREENIELRKNLLDECQELEEFKKDEFKEPKERMVVFDSKERFSAAMATLSLENQLRFKKCILKCKGILYKDERIEVGVVTCFKELNIIRLKLCITNTSPRPITEFKISFKDIQEIQETEGSMTGETPKSIPCNYQEQWNYTCKIKHKDFRIPDFTLTFSSHGASHAINLLFPLSKCKLVQHLMIPQMPWENMEVLERVIPSNKHILPRVNKLKEYFPNVHDQKDKLHMSFSYLNQGFELWFSQIEGRNVRMRMLYERGNEDNAHELLDELSFLLSFD